MELQEFFNVTRERVQGEVAERIASGAGDFPSEELVFAEIVMEHLADAGICEEPQVQHYEAKVGNANVRMTGYALAEDHSQLDIFVSLYQGSPTLRDVSGTAIQTVAKQGVQFLMTCAKGRLGRVMDASNPSYGLVMAAEQSWKDLDHVRVFVITDGKTDKKRYSGAEVEGKLVAIEIMDMERLYRHTAAGKPRDEVAFNFIESIGSALPCVYVPDETADYDFALTALPGEVLRALYERYDQQLLEANVRSFLGVAGKHNKGIAVTLRDEPEHFMAFNNGLVIVADEAHFDRTAQGDVGISFLKGFQIVNGGQTTASIYFAKRKTPDIDLAHVRVPAKIIILRGEGVDREKLISNISRYANSQNAVKNSDLSANRAFHVQFEKLANSTYLPDGIGRWFYERAAGGYNVRLSLEGTTPAKLRKLKAAIPPSRKLSKNDVAKYVQAWRLLPHVVSLGGEKNFKAFMDALDETPDIVPDPLTVPWYKETIARAIIFRTVHKMVRPMFPQGQANVAAYLVSVISERLGGRLVMDRIWNRQEISEPFRLMLTDWAQIVFKAMVDRAGGKQIPEFAKRPECWEHVRIQNFPLAEPLPPEISA
ncbi:MULTISPECIES: AIPR family protein [Novosphingobium]|uniref:AIPR family protein n=1 Tax=Novosphingobium TaxID=165696 RepID=UPI0035B0822B